MVAYGKVGKMNSAEQLYIAVTFLVPGYILNTVLSTFSPQEKNFSVLRLTFLGTLNLAVCAPIILNWDTSWPTYMKVICIYLMTLIIPVLLGLTWSAARKYEVLRRVASKFSINTIHPCPTAWDYIFHKSKNGARVIVTLKDATIIYGAFDSESFAAESSHQDIYLEKMYKLGADSKWEDIPNSNGILISKDNVKTIEFFP